MESKGYTSLFALVDNHLSDTSLKESVSDEKANKSTSIPISCTKGSHNGSVSVSCLFSPNSRLPIPSLRVNNSPITGVLAEQVANMLKAKEKKQEVEIQEMEAKMNKTIEDDQDSFIDLMKALQTPSKQSHQPSTKSRSIESLFSHDFTKFEKLQKNINLRPLLPCMMNISSIIQQKICKAKCSSFGKVMMSRQMPVAAPYIKEKIESSIMVFNFAAKSPCDLIRQNLLRNQHHAINTVSA